MLLVAAVISAVTAYYAHESFTDVFIIMSVVIFNAIIGVVQENKADKAIEALKEMSAATSHVLRDGEMITIKSEDLVVGDIIFLEAGDSVPADARIIESASMKIEEAALTGESVPVSKLIDILNLSEGTEDVTLGDRKNMVYMGSTVAYGRGKAVVTDIGMATEMGKIAETLNQAEDELTPLQRKLNDFGKVLTKIVIGISVFVFLFTVFRQGDFSGVALLKTFMTAIALAVAAIPEGLTAVVTIVLSMGVTKMSRRSAVIRKLSAVEALGCAQIICSDKTGTLTQNKMTVVDQFSNDEMMLATIMSLCNDANIKPGEEHSVGEPTEAALVDYAARLGLFKYNMERVQPRIGEAPFDSGRKMMSTVHSIEGGSKLIQYTKGAPDVVLTRCSRYLEADGKIVPMTEEIRNMVLAKNKEFADQALRVLSAAYKEYDAPPVSYEAENLENDLIFVGITGMIDPCRPKVFAAIEECRNAGIRPIMITGDHKDTAVAIAKQLGIIEDANQALTGADIEKMTDEELAATVNNVSVYARVQPEHKSRIVKAWKINDKITAMTGDGVNDAPSIKFADIGVGMGITGTDVTKNVADMVLADDNFATIVNAIEEGRRIYDNIRKVIQFQMATNTSEVLCVFFASVLGFEIFTPAQLLWINMVTDSAPGLALGTEIAEPDIMMRNPRPSNDSVFSEGMGVDSVLQGVLMTLIVFASYFIGHYLEHGTLTIANSIDGMTMAFLTQSNIEAFHAINMRSQRGSIFKMKKANWWLVGAVTFSLIMTIAVVYIPGMSASFGLATISLEELAISLGLAFSIVPLTEFAKIFLRAIDRKKGRRR